MTSMQSLNTARAPAVVRNDTTIGRDNELDAYTIEEFCRRHSISRGTYYNMKVAGTGPNETRAMKRVLISKEAAQAWRTRQ